MFKMILELVEHFTTLFRIFFRLKCKDFRDFMRISNFRRLVFSEYALKFVAPLTDITRQFLFPGRIG